MYKKLIKKIRKTKNHKNQKGVTFIEMLIYMGLLAILLVILTEMFVSILDLRLDAQTTSGVDHDGKFIMTRLAYDINRAESITTPTVSGESSNTLEIIIGGVTNTYSVSGSILELSNGLGTSGLNGSTTTISDLSFLRLGNSIKYSFTVTSEAIARSGAEIRTFESTAGLKL